MSKYRKTIMAAISAAAVTVIAALDGNVSPEDVTTIAAAWSGVVLVWGVPNEPA